MYRIAYLNPYVGRAEEQAFRSLEEAGRGLGLVLEAVAPSELTEESPFDFVISTTAAVRKTTSHPTYLSAHLPRFAYLEEATVLSNTASYDGYLCIADTLARYFGNLAASWDKRLIEPGFYYNAPQVTGLTTDVVELVRRNALRLCYFGTNWEPRAKRLFRRLASRPYLRIYGPEAAWIDLANTGAYKGSPPFDGRSVQQEYAAHGAGLVSLGQDHLIDDVVSNRLLEIASVGACAVCPDIPWIRSRFGDSVHYYRPFADPEVVVGDIDAAMASIQADPSAAAAMAKEARERFAGRLDAATLLTNAVAYHEAWRAAEPQRPTALVDPLIDVIIRVGGRPVDTVRRAVDSLERQTAGRFRVIFVAYASIDLTAITQAPYDRVVEFLTVSAPGANRSRALIAGLDHLGADLFALLDDDDRLLSAHMAGLLNALARSGAERGFAYSDILSFDASERSSNLLDNGLRLLKEGPATGDIYALMQRFSSHCFLAHRACLDGVRRGHWDLETAEDVLLICALLRTATPVHSPHATAVYVKGQGDGSAFLEHPRRREDELALHAEISGWRAEIESRFPAAAADQRAFLAPLARRVTEERRDRLGVAGSGALFTGVIEVAVDEIDTAAGLTRGETVYEGRFADEPMIFASVPLHGGRAVGPNVALAAAGSVRLAGGRPWEILLTIDLSDYALPGCTTTALLAFEGSDSALWVGLRMASGDIVAQTPAASSRSAVVAGVTGPDATPLPVVILQAGAGGAEGVVVRGLKVGYRVSELTEVFSGGAAISEDELLARLEHRLSRQVVGVNPPLQAARSATIDFRSARCRFSRLVEDAPMAQGASRSVGSGRKPWDYFIQIHLPAEALLAGRWVHAVLTAVPEAASAFLVDAGFVQTLSPVTRLAAGKSRSDLWFDVPQSADSGAYLIVQCGHEPGDREFEIQSVEVLN